MAEEAFDALAERATDIAALTAQYLAEGRDLDKAWAEEAAPLFDALPALFSALEASRQREAEARDKALEEAACLVIRCADYISDAASPSWPEQIDHDEARANVYADEIRALKSTSKSTTEGEA